MRFEIPEYPPGAPCWLDLLASDVTRAHEFYTGLFGWELREPDETSGGYAIATLGGAPVAGYSEKPEGLDMESQWTTYLAVPDLPERTEVFAELGGHLLSSGTRMGSLGRTALGTDPTGALVGMWQPRRMPGAGVLEEPGALGWSELLTRAYGRSRVFYSRVFDHLFREEGGDIGDEEAVWATGFTFEASPAYALGQIDDDVPEQIGSHWMPYFAVEDVIDTLTEAVSLGATALRGAADAPYGRTAVLTGPEGERFGIIAPHD